MGGGCVCARAPSSRLPPAPPQLWETTKICLSCNAAWKCSLGVKLGTQRAQLIYPPLLGISVLSASAQYLKPLGHVFHLLFWLCQVRG